MAKLKIHHITKYTYKEPVRDSANQIMLSPMKDDYQEVLHHTISITGSPPIAYHVDYFNNEVGTFTSPQPHTELIINSTLEVKTTAQTLPDDTMPAHDQWNLLEGLKHQMQFADFLKVEAFYSLEEMQTIIENEKCREGTPLQVAKDFSAYIYNNFKYKKGVTTVESTPDEIWRLKSGVCQDFAHILLFMLRMVHIPARYVSGYVCPNKPGIRGEGATHAWVECFIPAMGWVGLDPTNNQLVNEFYVRLAVGKNFADCSPVKGTYRGLSDHHLEVNVTVQHEDGNITGKMKTDLLSTPVEPVKSFSRNSYRKYQEMQMQQ